MSNTSKEIKTAEKLEWLNDSWRQNENEDIETRSRRILKKSRENPLVPIGLATTVYALVYGIWNFYKGDRVMSQKMMRLRVGAQAFTLVTLMVSCVFGVKLQEKEDAQKK